MFVDLVARVRARASNPATMFDMAEGLSPAPQLLPQASAEQIAKTEAALGFALPPLLKQILREIGNGGFGPGYGVIGADGGYDDFGAGTLAQLYQTSHDPTGAAGWPPLPARVLPVCNWGCGIYSCLDCGQADAPVLVFDPEVHVLERDDLQATVTNAEGEVLWTYQPQAGPPEPKSPPDTRPQGIALVQHKASLAAWILAWAEGVNLWEEMEQL